MTAHDFVVSLVGKTVRSDAIAIVNRIGYDVPKIRIRAAPAVLRNILEYAWTQNLRTYMSTSGTLTLIVWGFEPESPTCHCGSVTHTSERHDEVFRHRMPEASWD